MRTDDDIFGNFEARMRREKVRRNCHRIAESLGCTIEFERDIQLYWVNGPRGIYDRRTYDSNGVPIRDDSRPDPREGNHGCYGWHEVLAALEDYRVDLFFDRLCLCHEIAKLVVANNGGLLEPWMDKPNETERGHILADWLTDHDFDDVASTLRSSLPELEVA